MSSSLPVMKFLDSAARYFGVYALIALLFLLSVIAIPFLSLGTIKVPFFLIGLYYWAVYRPRLILPWLAFICGFIMDVLANFPLGLNAFLYVAAQALIISQRRFLTVQNFSMVWVGFAATVVLVLGVQWVVMAVFAGRHVGLETLLFEAGMGVLAYPFVALVLSVPHRLLPDAHASHIFKA